MENNMNNNNERKFINLSKPISDLYENNEQVDIMPNGYQEDKMPNGYQNNNGYQEDRMPNGYQQDRIPNGYNTNQGFNPQLYKQDIYPQNKPMYKEVNIPNSSIDMPTVQPSFVNPPVVQNTPFNNTNTQSQEKYCKYCGQKIHQEAVVCPHCGRQIENLKGGGHQEIVGNNVYVNNGYPMTISPYSKSTSLLLACMGFIGLGGLHRIYSGKYASGILYLLTCGLCGVGTIVDVIRIASGEFRDKNGFQIKK